MVTPRRLHWLYRKGDTHSGSSDLEGDPHVPPSSFQSRKVKNSINSGFVRDRHTDSWNMLFGCPPKWEFDADASY